MVRLFFVFILVVPTALLLSCAPHSGIYHTVEPGQTLYRISRTYGVDEKNLARLNGIGDPTQLRVGQRIFIPGATQERQVPRTAGAARPAQTTPPAASASRPPAATPAPPPATTRAPAAPASPSAPAPAPTPPRPSATTIGKGHFAWPLQGEVLKKYGQQSGTTHRGIEIAGGKGTPVRSAAAGRVIYSGDGIRGYGNLIIVEHDENFFTVYGFNERNLVQDGTFVGRGEHIASVGVPPGGGAPRLYFEVRRGKDTVDPLFYLP
ncbi:peptidoglycan DD-metalloendopeptidase family protein [Geoalkalibacter halelectricus]|uniref:Peptidoglycan DD-metalloendopeptidase family protein n=1 Tax=Geoalkalibacter halelectricus TaxID=2847045 RepID=A0ABY5ZNP1_9BACT|nr:peptidoglycan DD-metalloendopeptidase family protein [Geoalkalibacter halelectricus]MDO3380004.1 peptidoglycan DD-metalloendopeptidase family protein [Geoalkalibacter halelectricus]UWZ80469.1 peptidoglycan DD-metalloendopeptidase family protein [Geoalkalibacter halelectricus]